MAFVLSISLSILVTVATSIIGTPQAFGFTSCSDPLRNQKICSEMRHLRSQVNLLEAQRDLIRVDYSYLDQLASDIEELVTGMMDDQGRVAGLEGIESLRERVRALKKYAKAKNPKALVAANQLHGECLKCHSSHNPKSGYSWNTVAEYTWGRITLKCNQEVPVYKEDGSNEILIEPAERTGAPLRNPYRCKHMHAMFGALEYFYTSNEAGRMNYAMTAAAAKELNRISVDLHNKGIVHRGANDLLQNIATKASELQKLAEQENSLAAFKRIEIMNACTQCHDQGRRLPFSMPTGITNGFKLTN